MDLFVSLWLLAQPLIVICYLCIATVHQKLWLAGVGMNVSHINIIMHLEDWMLPGSLLILPMLHAGRRRRGFASNMNVCE